MDASERPRVASRVSSLRTISRSSLVPPGFECVAHPVFLKAENPHSPDISPTTWVAKVEGRVDDVGAREDGDEDSGGDCRERGMRELESNCPICLGRFVSPVTLCSCLHTYCYDCILQWYEHILTVTLSQRPLDRSTTDSESCTPRASFSYRCPLCQKPGPYFLAVETQDTSPRRETCDASNFKPACVAPPVKPTLRFKLFGARVMKSNSSRTVGGIMPSGESKAGEADHPTMDQLRNAVRTQLALAAFVAKVEAEAARARALLLRTTVGVDRKDVDPMGMECGEKIEARSCGVKTVRLTDKLRTLAHQESSQTGDGMQAHKYSYKNALDTASYEIRSPRSISKALRQSVAFSPDGSTIRSRLKDVDCPLECRQSNDEIKAGDERSWSNRDGSGTVPNWGRGECMTISHSFGEQEDRENTNTVACQCADTNGHTVKVKDRRHRVTYAPRVMASLMKEGECHEIWHKIHPRNKEHCCLDCRCRVKRRGGRRCQVGRHGNEVTTDDEGEAARYCGRKRLSNSSGNCLWEPGLISAEDALRNVETMLENERAMLEKQRNRIEKLESG
ncbi:unnamed protein product [Choristocarpus tenellus]